MAEPYTIYKLTILNLLDKVDFPLTNAQISNFFLDEEYTYDYFRIQQALGDLQDAALILAEMGRDNTRYRITPAGRETLILLDEKLNSEIDRDTSAYLEKNGIALRAANAAVADYYRAIGGKYAVRCRLMERESAVLDFTMSVNGKKQAEAVCDNWRAQHDDIYAYLVDALVK